MKNGGFKSTVSGESCPIEQDQMVWKHLGVINPDHYDVAIATLGGSQNQRENKVEKWEEWK